MKVRFLGGVNEVGRLGMLLEHAGTRLLFDYGIAPSDPPKYPDKCPPIDAALLSHAHIDHSGMMPLVAGEQGTPVLGTPPTATLSELLAHDSLKVCRAEGYPEPYAKGHIGAFRSSFEPLAYGERRETGILTIDLHSAGHIPGSAMFEVRNGTSTLLFTGDLNLIDTRLVRKAEPVRCDTLVVEATYSGRQHPPRPKVEEEFLDAVDGIVSQGGTVIVPSFAVGRTQEILLLLHESGYEVHLDGMGKTVSRLMLDEPRYLRSPRDLARAMDATRVVHSRAARERALEGDVIVTTSGMMEGGPVLYYMEKLRKDASSAVFFTGYQVEGTGGRQLLDTGTFPLDGKSEPVASAVRSFDFSAHAGHDEIVKFARECGPKRVILFHSDRREPLAQALREFAEVHLPVTGQEVDLDGE